MSTISVENAAPSVTLTESAVRRVKFLMERKAAAGIALRLGVKGGGCSGLSYTMNLVEADKDITDKDLQFQQDGITIVVDRKSARFLDGTELDYTTANLLEGGWKWSNPNAKRSCGCGTSFTPA
jgi:iron-sulfur cluster assembly protein